MVNALSHYRERKMGDMKLAQMIKLRRIERGWTQEELAARTGVEQSHISKLERLGPEKHTPAVLRVCKLLDIAVE